MDGNELPDGWMRVQSKSRPDKVYFYHKEKKLSLWKIEDIKKINQGIIKLKDSKSKSPLKSSAMTIKKSTGVSNESKAIKKNTAKERMTKLQKKFMDEVKRGNASEDPVTKFQLNNVKGISKHEDSIIKDISSKISNVQKKLVKASAVAVKNVAAQRMKKLKSELKGEECEKGRENASKKIVPAKLPESQHVPSRNDSQNEVEMMEVSFEKSSQDTLEEYEPMDWEEIPEEKILLEIQQIRRINSTDDQTRISHQSNFTPVQTEFYVIVDTNVLLSNVEYLKEIKGKMFKDIGKATIFLPYIVLIELDRLKTREGNVSKLARRAITFIDECFLQKDPFFIGQSAAVTKPIIPINSGDDEILNSCLQIKKTTKKVILLTNDKNLRNKAFVNKVESLSCNMLNFVEYNVKNDLKFD